MVKEKGRRAIATNRRARHDYELHERFEAGLVLTGTEVKSLRAGRASLAEAYVAVEDGEVWLLNASISEYSFGTWTNHAPRRKRKLLLHATEIRKLDRESSAPGRTIVPLQMYFQDGFAKVEIAVATGKREWDKRQTIAARDAEREAQRALRARTRRSTDAGRRN